MALVSCLEQVLKGAMSVAGTAMIRELGLSAVQFGIILGAAALLWFWIDAGRRPLEVA